MKPLKSRHAASEKKRREIINAALHCFVDKGYSQTRITDICKQSHANTGSIYHHFKSKEGLAARVYLAGIRDYQAGYIRCLAQETDAKKGIYAVVAYHLHWVETRPDWAKFLIQKRHAEFMGTAAEHLKEMNQGFMLACGDWFRNHIESGVFKPLPKTLFVAILLGPCQEYAKLMVSGTITEPNVADAARNLGDAAWLSLCRAPENR